MSTNPLVKTAPRTESGLMVQTLLDQRAVFEDAYAKKAINKEQYDQAIAFNNQQLAQQQAFAAAPTTTPAPVIATDQRTDAWQESVDFYNSIGKPEYGGIYGKPDIPEGFTVTNVTKNSEGELEFELYGQPQDSNALDQAIEADQIRKAFMLDANARQGTSPTGISLQQITANLSPEEKTAFNEYQKQTVTASMTNLGLTFAVGAAPIVAPVLPIIGVAAPTVIAGEVAGVGFAQLGKSLSGGGALTLDETLGNAALGGALSGAGSLANTALKIGGAGVVNAAGRVGVNSVIGASASAGIELVTTGKVTMENVATGAALGAGIGVAAEVVGAGASFLKNQFTSKPVGTYDTTAYKVGEASDIYALPEPSNAGNVARSPQQQAVFDFNTNRNLDTFESGFGDLQLGSRASVTSVKAPQDLYVSPKPKGGFTVGDFNDPNAAFRSDPLSDLIAAKRFQLYPDEQTRIAKFEQDAALDQYYGNLPEDAWLANFGKKATASPVRASAPDEILASVAIETPTLSRPTAFLDPSRFADAERLFSNAQTNTPNLARANEALAPSEAKPPMSLDLKAKPSDSFFSKKHSSWFRSPIVSPVLDRGVSDSAIGLTVAPSDFGGLSPSSGASNLPSGFPSTLKVPSFPSDLPSGGSQSSILSGFEANMNANPIEYTPPSFNPQPQPQPQPNPNPNPIQIPDFKVDFGTKRHQTTIEEMGTKTILEEMADFKTDAKAQSLPQFFTEPRLSTKGTKGLNFGNFDLPKGSNRVPNLFGRGYRQTGRIYPIVTGKQFMGMGFGKLGKGLIKKTRAKSKGRKKK